MGFTDDAADPLVTRLLLFKFTEQGIRTVKDHPKRSSRALDLVTQAGGKCVFYLTAGGVYDMVSVITGLDDLALARLVLSLDSLGTVKTTALTGLRLGAGQWAKLLSEIPAPPK